MDLTSPSQALLKCIQLTPEIFGISGHILETERFLFLQQIALLNTYETVLQKMVLNYLYFTSCGSFTMYDVMDMQKIVTSGHHFSLTGDLPYMAHITMVLTRDC